MPHVLLRGDSPEITLRAAVVAELDAAVQAIELEDDELAVHGARKRCKATRAVLRLFRPGLGSTYADANGRLRDAARLVSGARDATVMQATLEALAADAGFELDGEALAGFRSALAANHHLHYAGGAQSAARMGLQALRTELVALRAEVPTWCLVPDRDAVLARGLAKTYGRARGRTQALVVDSSPHAFHQLRKRVKYLMHELVVVAPVWPTAIQALEAGLKALSDTLGDAHDLAELEGFLVRTAADVESLEAVLIALRARRQRLEDEATRSASRAFVAPGRTAETVLERWLAQWRTDELPAWSR